MPVFDGEDAYGWVYKIERFFEVQGLVTTGEKLRAAVLSMEGHPIMVPLVRPTGTVSSLGRSQEPVIGAIPIVPGR